MDKFDKESTRRIRLFVCGSASLSKSLYDQVFERTGRKLLQRFGMTEGRFGVFICNFLHIDFVIKYFSYGADVNAI